MNITLFEIKAGTLDIAKNKFGVYLKRFVKAFKSTLVIPLQKVECTQKVESVGLIRATATKLHSTLNSLHSFSVVLGFKCTESFSKISISVVDIVLSRQLELD